MNTTTLLPAAEPAISPMRLVSPNGEGRLPILEQVVRTCGCQDTQLALMFDLMDEGLDQPDASRIAFGATPSLDATRLAWKAWCRVYVYQLGQELRARLGLREEAAPR